MKEDQKENIKESINLESLMFEYLDKIKYLISPELWGNEVLNCTKNEAFVLFFLYHNSDVNMTQIAEYLTVPLNTATGIISRMEKKSFIQRIRSAQDKRVVTIQMTEEGKQQIRNTILGIMHYGNLILDAFTGEEIELVFKLIDKVFGVLADERRRQEQGMDQKSKIRKITIE